MCSSDLAAAAAEVLAGLPIDRVIASPLRRCMETATIATQHHGLEIEQRADLREIEPGHLRNIPAESIREVFVGAFSAAPTSETRFLGGETFGSMLGRVLPAFDALLADPGWKQMVVVAHGAVNRGILTRALGSGLAGFGAIEQDACCINVLDFDGAGRAVVRLVNFTPYNPAKVGLELTTMERLFLQYRPG